MIKGTCHSCELAEDDERPDDCTCCPTCGSPWCDWLGKHPDKLEHHSSAPQPA